MLDKQAKEEIRVFREFAKISPYPIALSSIKKEEPPKPDISCELRDGTSMAFEVVECIDTSFARLSSDTPKLRNMLREEVKKLSTDKREEFNKIFGNANIHVSFVEEASLKMKSGAILKIIDYLLTLEDFAVGTFLIRNHQKLKNVVRRISITRGQLSRPDFTSSFAAWSGEPARESIEDKFTRKYATEWTVELLAYYELQPVFPEDHSLKEVQDFVVSKIDNSPFERVWIYSVPRNHIIYVYPPI